MVFRMFILAALTSHALYGLLPVAYSAEALSESQPQKDTGLRVLLAPNGVGMPLHNFMLVRQGQKYCALHFTRFSITKDEATRKENYESYFGAADVKGIISVGDMIRNTGTVTWEEPKSIVGRLALKQSEDRVLCGDFVLRWTPPGFVYFPRRSETKMQDAPMEFAPTGWQNLKTVDFFVLTVKNAYAKFLL